LPLRVGFIAREPPWRVSDLSSKYFYSLWLTTGTICGLKRGEGEDVEGKDPLTTWWNVQWYSLNVLFRYSQISTDVVFSTWDPPSSTGSEAVPHPEMRYEAKNWGIVSTRE
jgi:hypothetical protein